MNENGQERKKKKLWTILFVLINIAVIAATAVNEFSGNKGSLTDLRFTPKAWIFLGCAAGCLAVLFFAETLKYLLMMRSLKEKVSLRIAFETAALGKYYDCITPSGAGGQPFQILWLHRHGYSDGAASAMTITGYVTMQSGFILLALVIFITRRSVELEAIRYTAYFGLLLFALMSASAAARPPTWLIDDGVRKNGSTIIGMLDSYRSSLAVIEKDKVTSFCLVVLSLVYRIALCSMPYFVLKMFGAPVSFMHIFASTIYIYASICLVPTPGNAGAAEGAFYLVFSAMRSDGVFWAMLIWRIFSHYSFILAGAVIYGVNALQGRRPRGGEADE